MSGGLYSTENRTYDKSMDLKRIKPYGDTLNDGKVQVSFTLPVPDDDRAVEAAKILAEKMGIEDPEVVFHKSLDTNFAFFIVYGSLQIVHL